MHMSPYSGSWFPSKYALCIIYKNLIWYIRCMQYSIFCRKNNELQKYASHFWGHGGHLRSHFCSWWGQVTSNWSKTLKGGIMKSLPFIWYVTCHWIRKSHCWGHGGHLRSCFWSWWDQMTSNWSKTLKGRILKSLPFIWYVTWQEIHKSHCCGHGGHLRSHFWSWWGQMTSNRFKTLKGQILKSLPFVWYVTRRGLIFFPQGGGGGRVQVNWAKKLLILLNFLNIWTKSCLMAKKSQKSQQTKSGPPPLH